MFDLFGWDKERRESGVLKDHELAPWAERAIDTLVREDDYTIEGFLGKGTVGVVLAARANGPKRRGGGKDEAREDELLAIKLRARADGHGEPVSPDYTVYEGLSQVWVEHPNILPVRSIGVRRDFTYVVTERALGGTVEELMANRELLTPDVLVTILGQVCDGMEALADEKIFHADVRPANVLLKRPFDGNAANLHVMLGDFNHAQVRGKPEASLGEDGPEVEHKHYFMLDSVREQWNRLRVERPFDVPPTMVGQTVGLLEKGMVRLALRGVDVDLLTSTSLWRGLTGLGQRASARDPVPGGSGWIRRPMGEKAVAELQAGLNSFTAKMEAGYRPTGTKMISSYESMEPAPLGQEKDVKKRIQYLPDDRFYVGGGDPFKPPEVFGGGAGWTRASNQFVVAQMAFEMIAGYHPFARFDPGGGGRHGTTRLSVLPLPEETPEAIRETLSIGLSKDRGDRYASFGEFTDALLGAIGGERHPVVVEPTSRVEGVSFADVVASLDRSGLGK